MYLSEEIIKTIKTDKKLRRALEDLFEISERSLYRWLRDRNSRFTEIASLSVISIYTRKPISEIVDEPITILDENEC